MSLNAATTLFTSHCPTHNSSCSILDVSFLFSFFFILPHVPSTLSFCFAHPFIHSLTFVLIFLLTDFFSLNSSNTYTSAASFLLKMNGKTNRKEIKYTNEKEPTRTVHMLYAVCVSVFRFKFFTRSFWCFFLLICHTCRVSFFSFPQSVYPCHTIPPFHTCTPHAGWMCEIKFLISNFKTRFSCFATKDGKNKNEEEKTKTEYICDAWGFSR